MELFEAFISGTTWSDGEAFDINTHEGRETILTCACARFTNSWESAVFHITQDEITEDDVLGEWYTVDYHPNRWFCDIERKESNLKGLACIWKIYIG